MLVNKLEDRVFIIIHRLMIFLFLLVFLVSCTNQHLRTDKRMNIEQNVQDYVNRYGIYAFFHEYKNLISSKPHVVKENSDLAVAFGVKFERDKLPVTIEEPEDTLYYSYAKIVEINSILINYFDKNSRYSEYQRDFFKWYFLIPPFNNAALTFQVKPDYYILGWENFLILEIKDKLYVNAFGFYSCTAFIAFSGRYIFFQHSTDDDPKELFEFIEDKKEDEIRVFVINGAPFRAVKEIKDKWPLVRVFYHHKTDNKISYFINLTINSYGPLKIRHCNSGEIVFDICENISRTCEAITLGRFFPKDDCRLEDTEFIEHR